MRTTVTLLLLFLTLILGSSANAQISPGELAAVHSKLEGMSNCTKCHELGDKVTNAKCLACHTELKARIDQNKGYHASTDARGKKCTECHSDHHGLNFQILRFDKDKFNHNLAGYPLTGAHAKRVCRDCHNPEFIANNAVKVKKFTFLGLRTDCLGCHKDYHQQTLSPTCTNCHGMDAFKPVTKFSHSATRFPLVGMHQTVACVKCHAITTKNGVTFQAFAGINFSNCTSCHSDIHQNKFGQNCRQCHSEVSFHTIKAMSNFDHSKTNYNLEDKHLAVPCSSCHKNNVTAPLKHDRCTDCHQDYHEKQFLVNNVVTDCSHCHSTKGYDQTSFTVEQHNQGRFRLEGAHLATPCFSCHKKTEKWSFRQIGIVCTDCHKNIHERFLAAKFYPDGNCRTCHNPSRWNDITFDHSGTGFALAGVHAIKDCRICHMKPDSTGNVIQRFSGLSTACATCHQDVHFKQFEVNGLTNCLKCHTFDQWAILNFDHNSTAFKLDGKHKNVPCAKCHKSITDGQNTYVLYKIKEYRCENCH
jgi:nitrate/TMAO reductase-like tetraheme cytochrome c subunit